MSETRLRRAGIVCVLVAASMTSSCDKNEREPCVGPPGLYADDACAALAEGLLAYEPAYWLWSDGLDKARFLYLPPGTQIDTSDPDRWVFPVGTRVYKTFIEDGVRLETRLIERVAETGSTNGSGWSYRTFLWNEAQSAVTELMDGQKDVLGTTHDVPTISDCLTCHNGLAQDALLSVGAIQLNHTRPGVTLASLTDAGALTHAIAPEAATIPGTPAERAAFGYLHANCGNCHRPSGGLAGGATMPRFHVPVGVADVTMLPAYTTTVDVCSAWPSGGPAVKRVDPMHPTTSAIYMRMGERDMEPPITLDPDQMPPLASEVVDTDGRAAVAAWISALPASATTCP